MKTRLNLTIDSKLLRRVKRFAAAKEMSISELIENYFKRLTKPSPQKNIIELVEHSIPPQKNLKKAFYEEH